MGVFAVTAGSFGDFVTVLQLAWTIRRILSEARAAPKEVQDLIEDIDSFTHALQITKAVLEGTANLEPSVANGVAHSLGICTTVLRRTSDKLKSYEEAFARKRNIKKWTQGLRSAHVWTALGGKIEVEALKRRLADQVSANSNPNGSYEHVRTVQLRVVIGVATDVMQNLA